MHQQTLPAISAMSSGLLFVHLATRWCSCTPGSGDCAVCTAAASLTDARLHRTRNLATQLYWPKPSTGPVDYGICGQLQECVYREPIRDLKEFKKLYCEHVGWCETKCRWQGSNSGGKGCRPASVLKDDNSSIQKRLSLSTDGDKCARVNFGGNEKSSLIWGEWKSLILKVWILCINLIINSLQFTVSEIWLWCFYEYGGVLIPKDYSLFAGASTPWKHRRSLHPGTRKPSWRKGYAR